MSDAIATASPRPWRLDDGFACEIVDATGRHVLTSTSKYAVPPLGDDREAANAALIIEAVNERDRLRWVAEQRTRLLGRQAAECERLRGIVRRLLRAVDAMHALVVRTSPDMLPVEITPGTSCLGVDVGDVVREARAAVEEG